MPRVRGVERASAHRDRPRVLAHEDFFRPEERKPLGTMPSVVPVEEVVTPRGSGTRGGFDRVRRVQRRSAASTCESALPVFGERPHASEILSRFRANAR